MITLLIFLFFFLFFLSSFSINGYIDSECMTLTVLATIVFGFLGNFGISYLFSSYEEVSQNYSLIPIVGETLLSQDSNGFTFRIRKQVENNSKKPTFQELNEFTNEWYKTETERSFVQHVIEYRKFKKGIWFFACPDQYIINEKYILYLPLDYEAN